jgi:hypothetical protein
MRYLGGIVLAAAALATVSCSRPPQIADQAATSPEARIQQIPPADPQKYAGTRATKEWQNPYLIIKADGVALLDVANHEEHLLKPEELSQALAKLPASAWPYGRVVAATENSVRAPGDDVLIRKNRGIVAGTLESMHVLINWVPSA